MSNSSAINLLNYLKGNFLLSKNSIISTIEGLSHDRENALRLHSYSISHNTLVADRFVVRVCFLQPGQCVECREALKENMANNLSVFKKTALHFDIFIRETLNGTGNINHQVLQKGGLGRITEGLIDLNSRSGKGMPGIIYLEGLEIAEFYHETSAIINLLADLTKKTYFIKQVQILLWDNVSSGTLIKLIAGISNSRILLEPLQLNQATVKKVKHIVTKTGGYSDIKEFKLNFSEVNKNGVATPVLESLGQDEKKENEANEVSLEKTFKTSFNVSLTEEQRRNKEKVELPFMKALLESKAGKKKIIELDPEDMDMEQDEDDDLDV